MGRRKLRRMSRSAALYIPISVLLIAFLMVFGISVFMKIMEIEVIGASVYTEEEIILASGITSNDNLLFIDTDAASRSIQTDMSFIKGVRITRVPPSAIRIEVTESMPIALIVYQDSVLVIDSGCRVLKIEDNSPEGLIEVRGLSHDVPVEGSALKSEMGSETQVQSLKDVLGAIEKEGIEKDVSYLDVTSFSKISLGYLDRFRLIVGNPTNVRHKLSSLPGAVTQIKASNPEDTTTKWVIDMSDPSGRWRSNKEE